MAKVLSMKRPSHRIRLANHALRWWCSSPKRRVYMGDWHGKVDGFCYACYGGAAAIYAYGKDKGISVRTAYKGVGDITTGVDQDCVAENLGVDENSLIYFEQSLDAARIGNIGLMFSTMGLSVSKGRDFNRVIVSYEFNPERFLHDMEQLADDLEAAGY